MNMKFLRQSNKYIENNWGKDKPFEKEYEFCVGMVLQ